VGKAGSCGGTSGHLELNGVCLTDGGAGGRPINGWLASVCCCGLCGRRNPAAGGGGGGRGRLAAGRGCWAGGGRGGGTLSAVTMKGLSSAAEETASSLLALSSLSILFSGC
jgi:hypothetical protein